MFMVAFCYSMLNGKPFCTVLHAHSCAQHTGGSSFSNGCKADPKEASPMGPCDIIAFQKEPSIYVSLHLPAWGESVRHALLLILLQTAVDCVSHTGFLSGWQVLW